MHERNLLGASTACISARVFFGHSKTGFDDEFQYIDFKLPWEEQKAIKCYPDFKQEDALRACEARQNKKDRHPYLIPAG